MKCQQGAKHQSHYIMDIIVPQTALCLSSMRCPAFKVILITCTAHWKYNYRGTCYSLVHIQIVVNKDCRTVNQ